MLARVSTEEFFTACEQAIAFWEGLQSQVGDSMSQAEAKVTYGKKITRCTHMSNLCLAVRQTETHVEVTPEDFDLVRSVWKWGQKYSMTTEQDVS